MRSPHEITLLDLLMEGHGGSSEVQEVHDGRFLRRVALPDAETARLVFDSMFSEAVTWLGYPETTGNFYAGWPDLELVYRGRVIYAAVRYHGVDAWWEDAWADEDEGEDDGSAAAWAVLFGEES